MTDKERLSELESMLQRFASGEDRSMDFAYQIEDFAYEHFPSEEFPDPDVHRELITALACYNPFGGEDLYDEQDMARVCRGVLWYLEHRDQVEGTTRSSDP